MRDLDWNREEAEATVGVYLDMLELELGTQPFVKADRIRALLPLLNKRTRAALEWKLQNVSAILLEEGLPYIAGYKPARNYQHLLRDVTVEQVEQRERLLALVQREVTSAAAIPQIDDILQTLVAPPEPRNSGPLYVRERREPLLRTKVNYLFREARNESLGKAGEAFVLRFEKARLIAAKQERLAEAVEHVSAVRGDGAGFDVLSFEVDGRERLIEVKTTAFGEYTPFFVTANELEVSQRKANQYHLYRTFTFRKRPRLFVRSGQLDRVFALHPSAYVARVR